MVVNQQMKVMYPEKYILSMQFIEQWQCKQYVGINILAVPCWYVEAEIIHIVSLGNYLICNRKIGKYLR